MYSGSSTRLQDVFSAYKLGVRLELDLTNLPINPKTETLSDLILLLGRIDLYSNCVDELISLRKQ